jgi:FtsP/CotA-like multicopper oxidase with cupredoxin domain
MHRRDFVKLGSLAAASTKLRGQMQMAPAAGAPPADLTLTIAPVTVELAPDRILSTMGYNGTAPGPVLRMKEGQPIIVDVINHTDTPELVHWHGLLIPGNVDGVEEQDTPFVPANGRYRYSFTPGPSGSRWYHSHAMAMADLHKGAFTGQFGFVYIDPASDPGQYDQEHFLALRDWEPFYTRAMEDTDEQDDPDAPQPEKPAVLNTEPNGLEVNSTTYSINDKALGAGEPIRVKQGQRVLFHFLNASAIENRRISLPGHTFRIVAMDGNPVPTPGPAETLVLGAGERICAIVEMNNPGVWIMGAPEDTIRAGGLGVVVEYGDQHKQPTWAKPFTLLFDYTHFGRPVAGTTAVAKPRSSLFNAYTPPGGDSTAAPAAAPGTETIEMIFEKIPAGAAKFNTFLINGKPYPHENEFALKTGTRYRLIMRNRTDDAHPMHLHRHQMELIDINGKPTAGLIKDTVIVPFYGRATVEFVAQPGLSLFHCHIQQHMDYGFKALLRVT